MLGMTILTESLTTCVQLAAAPRRYLPAKCRRRIIASWRASRSMEAEEIERDARPGRLFRAPARGLSGPGVGASENVTECYGRRMSANVRPPCCGSKMSTNVNLFIGSRDRKGPPLHAFLSRPPFSNLRGIARTMRDLDRIEPTLRVHGGDAPLGKRRITGWEPAPFQQNKEAKIWDAFYSTEHDGSWSGRAGPS
jgi:hypothetical protein